MGRVMPCRAKLVWRLKIFEKIEKRENSIIKLGIIREGRRGLGKNFYVQESSPLQFSGAVTRLTVYRAAPHQVILHQGMRR